MVVTAFLAAWDVLPPCRGACGAMAHGTNGEAGCQGQTVGDSLSQCHATIYVYHLTTHPPLYRPMIIYDSHSIASPLPYRYPTMSTGYSTACEDSISACGRDINLFNSDTTNYTIELISGGGKDNIRHTRGTTNHATVENDISFDIVPIGRPVSGSRQPPFGGPSNSCVHSPPDRRQRQYRVHPCDGQRCGSRRWGRRAGT